MKDTVTVVIPTIPPRTRLLGRALLSVLKQTHPSDAISISIDNERIGAAANRNKALMTVKTKWTCFLDDDDELYNFHIENLLHAVIDGNFDLCYPWFDINGPESGIRDPWGAEGKLFDPIRIRTETYIPITVLVRTSLIQDVGGFVPLGPPSNPCEDRGGWIRLLDAGAKFVHLPLRTWNWNWWEGNTSGRADVW